MHWSFRIKPLDSAVDLPFIEADEVPELGIQRLERLVVAEVDGADGLQVVPLLTGDLARLAADARGGVDEL